MWSIIKLFVLYFMFVLAFCGFIPVQAKILRQRFVLQDASFTRLCSRKSILSVNGQFPGPTLYARVGDTVIVDVVNRATENITIHWHGVKQPGNPWTDGPAYITQCPIRAGTNFSQRILLSDEIGTLWWHAHIEWSRATVYGALIVYPKEGDAYPFPKPAAEFPILLGEWWKRDIKAMLSEALQTGSDPNASDAYLINGHPGDLYPCSASDTFKVTVEYGKTYLLRMINDVMNTIMFFKIANHNLTVVGSDASYTKPFSTDYVAISPGQTIDVLLQANQQPSHYYMASRPHNVAGNAGTTTTTAILIYSANYSAPSSPLLPTLPEINDTLSAESFTARLRSSPATVDVPHKVDQEFLFTLSVNIFECSLNESCNGSLQGRFRASINNMTFVQPKIDILEAYYNRIKGVYGEDFPQNPPYPFNYTMEFVPRLLWVPQNATEVRVVEYNTSVEIVFQGTNILSGTYHPMHLHGYSFYVVGRGSGNFDRERDPSNYNLVDPPLQNTIAIPRNGWTAIRFKANNPGVWLLHCHLDRHVSWGMETAIIVKEGTSRDAKMLPPPPDMPRC